MWNYWAHSPIYLYHQVSPSGLLRGSREHFTRAGEYIPLLHPCYMVNLLHTPTLTQQQSSVSGVPALQDTAVLAR